MQQRYYDPIAGRFLSVDPVTTDTKTGSSFSRYVYGNNNPYKFKDPDGRFAETLWDIASLALSVNEFRNNPSIGNAIGVAVDAAAAILPGIPGGVGAIRAADKAADAAGAYKKYTPGGNFSRKTKADTAERANHTCEYCGTKTDPAKKSESGVTPPKNEGQTDHVVPKSEGGTNAPSNAAHSCRECNREMSNMPKPHPREKLDAN